MAYDESLEARINALWLEIEPEASDRMTLKKMFGGLAYLYSGKMTVGIVGDRLMARVPGDRMETVLEQPGVSPMDFTGKPLREFVYVDPESIRRDSDLASWMRLGLEHARNKLKTGK